MRVWLDQDDGQAWLAKQPSADLIITEPPHSVDTHFYTDVGQFATWIDAALETLKPTGHLFAAVGPYPTELAAYLEYKPYQVLVWPFPRHHPVKNWGFAHGHHQVLWWKKPNSRRLMDGHYTSVLDGEWDDIVDDLMERALYNIPEGEEAIVLDPFVGNGRHLKAAKTFDAEWHLAFGGCDIREEAIERCKALL